MFPAGGDALLDGFKVVFVAAAAAEHEGLAAATGGVVVEPWLQREAAALKGRYVKFLF